MFLKWTKERIKYLEDFTNQVVDRLDYLEKEIDLLKWKTKGFESPVKEEDPGLSNSMNLILSVTELVDSNKDLTRRVALLEHEKNTNILESMDLDKLSVILKIKLDLKRITSVKIDKLRPYLVVVDGFNVDGQEVTSNVNFEMLEKTYQSNC